MRIASGAAAVLLAWLALRLIKAGVREWRDTGHEPLSHQMRSMAMMDDESLAGRDRGAIIMGLSFAFWSAPFAVVALAGNDLGQNTPLRLMWAFIAVLGFAGFLICVALYELILNFNRPKFLVPPKHRHEPGAIAGRRRRKHDRVPLKTDWRSAEPAVRAAFEAAAAQALPASPVPPGSAVILVARRRTVGIRDSLRGYKIVIDGRPAGKVKRGQTAELPAPPGQHDMRLQIGRWASRSVIIDASAGEVIRLTCEPDGPDAQPYRRTEDNRRVYISLTRV